MITTHQRRTLIQLRQEPQRWPRWDGRNYIRIPETIIVWENLFVRKFKPAVISPRWVTASYFYGTHTRIADYHPLPTPWRKIDDQNRYNPGT